MKKNNLFKSILCNGKKYAKKTSVILALSLAFQTAGSGVAFSMAAENAENVTQQTGDENVVQENEDQNTPQETDGNSGETPNPSDGSSSETPNPSTSPAVQESQDPAATNNPNETENPWTPGENRSERDLEVTSEALFTVDAEGTLIGFNGVGFDYNNNVVVPNTVNGIEVKSIGSTAFANNDKITAITLPNTITSFKDLAFDNCVALSSMNTYNPTDVTEAEGRKYVKVMDYADGEIKIPDSLTSISSTSFKTTKAIKKFFVTESNQAFSTSNDGVLLLSKDGLNLFRYASAHHESYLYTLPEGLVNIYDYACESAMDVQGFVIPSSVQTIGNYGFYAGGNLMWIYFNELTQASQLTTVGAYCFASNANLSTSLPKSVTSMGEYCFAYSDNLRETCDITKYSTVATQAGIIARTSITNVPNYCFYGCPNLHYVDLPATLQTIGDYAFSGCANMDTVNFAGNSLSSIGAGAFEGNANLHKISIPEGVTTIADSTFSGCQNLNTVHLPETLTTIGDNAFSNCNNIHEMNIPASVTSISSTAFANVTNFQGIDTSKNAYADALLGKYSIKPTATPAAVVVLPVATKGSVFVSGKYKYKVTAATASGASVMLMGFKNKKLKKTQRAAVIPATTKNSTYSNFKVVAVKAKAFYGCKKLVKVTIGANVRSIGAKAFFKVRTLKRVTVKSGKLKKVGKHSFRNIHKKAVIKVPKKKRKKYTKLFKKAGARRVR